LLIWALTVELPRPANLYQSLELLLVNSAQ
jgi:hypothetical protein